MSANFLEKAIATVKKAVDADTAAEYEKAYQLYMNALELFMLVLKYEKNAKQKETIRAKAKEYMERAEKLKQHLADEQGRKKPGAIAANGKTSGGGGKGENGENGEEHDADTKKLRGALAGAILTDKPNIKWEDVAGLELAKEALKEAVILPIKFPHLFTGKRQPWKGILLYGPPGTGKSYLAKAVATEANSTFFSVSSSDLVSKWMGESERLVKQLFNMARENKPSIIFIDEIDALCGPRGEGESEASRRIKTELLVQMDGVGKDSKGVLILGATNIPWQLDAAIRRRFQRRVHITLPDLPARMKMFEISVGSTPCELKPTDYKQLAQLSEGYSGSDISIAVQDALMQPVRKIQTATHYKKVDADGVEKFTPCSPGDTNAIEMTWTDIESEQLQEPPLQVKDFVKAIKSSRPTVSGVDLTRNEEWTREFGSEGAGAAGSSAAYFLRQYANDLNETLEIDVFERNTYVGGRTTTVSAWDNSSIQIELGGSIFVEVNRILYEASKRFNLSTAGLRHELAGPQVLGIWNGEQIIVQHTISGSRWAQWWSSAKLLWRYGRSPVYTSRLVKDVVGRFLTMYDEPSFPWSSLSDIVEKSDLLKVTGRTGHQWLRENGISDLFAKEIIQASTRVNYAQNLGLIHGLETMVSMAADNAMSIDGGNWQIFDRMLVEAGANLKLGNTVDSIELEDDGVYEVESHHLEEAASSTSCVAGDGSSSDDTSCSPNAIPPSSISHYDTVILAAPFHQSNITFPHPLAHVPDDIEYVSLHVTLFASPRKLSPCKFNLGPNADVPTILLTTNPTWYDPPLTDRDISGPAGFWSLSLLRTATNPNTDRPEYIYKLFSHYPPVIPELASFLGSGPSVLDVIERDGEDGDRDADGFTLFQDYDDCDRVDVEDLEAVRRRLERMAGEKLYPRDEVVSWVYRKVWKSYPYGFPRVTFEEMELERGLWYTGGMESFISTMETAALMGKNVAALIAREWVREPAPAYASD